MRLLVFVQGRTVEDQIGFDDAFKTLLAEGGISAYRAVPWIGYAERGQWAEFFASARDCVEEFRPDIIYFQFFHYRTCPEVAGFFESLRRTVTAPLILLSAGDAFAWADWFGRRYPAGFLSAARSADVTFVTALGRCADYLAARGVKNITLLPLGACQVRFKPRPPDVAQYKPEFDVVFIGGGGGWYRCGPWSFSFYSGLKRDVMARWLSRRYGRKFGLFGPGWRGNPSWQGPIPYSQQLAVCRNAQVVFGGCPGISQDYYASDRPFIQGVSGIPLVDWHVPRMDRILEDGKHWYLVRDAGSMLRQIDRLLESDVRERLRQGAETAGYIHARLTQEAFMRFLVKTAAEVRRCRREGARAPEPEFDFFLPGVDPRAERPYALRNWQG